MHLWKFVYIMHTYYIIWVAVILHFATAECLIHTNNLSQETRLHQKTRGLSQGTSNIYTFMIHLT